MRGFIRQDDKLLFAGTREALFALKEHIIRIRDIHHGPVPFHNGRAGAFFMDKEFRLPRERQPMGLDSRLFRCIRRGLCRPDVLARYVSRLFPRA